MSRQESLPNSFSGLCLAFRRGRRFSPFGRSKFPNFASAGNFFPAKPCFLLLFFFPTVRSRPSPRCPNSMSNLVDVGWFPSSSARLVRPSLYHPLFFLFREFLAGRLRDRSPTCHSVRPPRFDPLPDFVPFLRARRKDFSLITFRFFCALFLMPFRVFPGQAGLLRFRALRASEMRFFFFYARPSFFRVSMHLFSVLLLCPFPCLPRYPQLTGLSLKSPLMVFPLCVSCRNWLVLFPFLPHARDVLFFVARRLGSWDRPRGFLSGLF